MRNPPVIRLEVRFGEEPGWHAVQSSSNQAYSYRYTGGDDDEGGIVATVGKGAVSGTLRLVGDRRFQVLDCQFTDDPARQLRFEGSANAGVIFDKNTEVLEAKYTVIVKDTENGDCTIPCDPMVRNVPV